jgi:hypothetical protein
MSATPELQAVVELFDKEGPQGPGPFTEADRRLAAAAADFGTEMLRQALAERQTHRVLLDAVAAALGASESMAQSLRGGAPRPEDPPPAAVLQRLREGLRAGPEAPLDTEETLRLAEAIRVVALRYGPPAVRHCVQLVEGVRRLLDEATGAGEARP